MAQTVEQLFQAGSSLAAGVLTIDFTTAGRNNGNIDDPTTITPAQAAGILIDHFASLSAANDDPTAGIGASATTTTDTYVANRGGTAVTQMRKSSTIYQYFQSTDATADKDNLVG